MDFPERINFAQEEQKTLKFWKENSCFEKSLEQSKYRPRYTFYDGPPFATGMPHYGHLLAGSIKDIRTRFAHQEGYHVERRFGWDCHGLPIEYEIDKLLGISGPQDVLKMGIDKYNAQCRTIVMRYSSEWESIVQRMGRWIDFKNDYKTMYPWFMESVWWVFKQMYEKGLVYHGVKVMPYSTACCTPLSNFEAGQNYKSVSDPSVVVTFPLDEDPNVSLLAWTTTPWTLPSNLALCVHSEQIYIKLKDKKTGKLYILMEVLTSAVYAKPDLFEVLEKFPGEKLVGKSYQPLFPYFARLKQSRNAFRVVSDNYVTTDSGTGVVHQAPYFGEDDHRVCLRYEIISKDSEIVCPLDESGKFVDPVTDFLGLHVKEADKHIIKKIKENGRLVSQNTCQHNYPFCWRSETPLIYKAVPTWFVRVEDMRERLLKNNAASHWVPAFIQEKRFANWLANARDWAVSRNRYWGTPIPIWRSDDGEEIVCVGSREELKRLANLPDTEELNDLHREFVDQITIPSRTGRGVLRRIPEVFDCWFESGSMPYAQQHYPFENVDEFHRGFPADFIAEGVDQTRGWFYTLLVVSTTLFDQPPFKNLIVNGIVLNEHGEKMSKKNKNFPDPLKVIEECGADALRLYLINSPVVRAEDMRFKESGVENVVREAFLPWYNACRFLLHTNVPMCEKRLGLREGELTFSVHQPPRTSNIMDQWIISSVHSLIKFVRKEMNEYRLYTVLPRLVKFIDQLTNWYVRMNRRRMRGEHSTDASDCVVSLHSTFYVLYHMCVLFAPFVPFITEFLYQRLLPRLKNDPTQEGRNKDSYVDSIHYHLLISSDACDEHILPAVEEKMRDFQTAVELGRQARDRRSLGLRCPLREVVVILREQHRLDALRQLEHYIKEELNVHIVTLESDKSKYGVALRAIPDLPRLGPRFKGKFKEITDEIKNLTSDALDCFLQTGQLTLKGGEVLTLEDLQVVYDIQDPTAPSAPAAIPAVDKTVEAGKNNNKKGKKGKAGEQVKVEQANTVKSRYEANSDNSGLLVLLDCDEDAHLRMEFLVRELTNRIQKMRKKAALIPSNPIHVVVFSKSEALLSVLRDSRYLTMAAQAIQQPIQLSNTLEGDTTSDRLIISETQQIEKEDVHLKIYARSEGPGGDLCSVTVLLLDQSHNPTTNNVKIRLENPKGSNFLPFKDIRFHASSLFQQSVQIYRSMEDLKAGRTLLQTSMERQEDLNGENIVKLDGKTLLAAPY